METEQQQQVRSEEIKIYVTPKKKEEAQKQAEKEGRKLSNFGRRALDQYMDQRQEA